VRAILADGGAASRHENIAHFPIGLVVTLGLLERPPFNINIEVKCVLTGQIETVVVHIINDDNSGERC